MLNRRFLRIKAFQALYSFSREEGGKPSSYKKRLLDGLDKTYELYLLLLSFPQEFKHFLVQELNAEKAKHYPSAEQIALLDLLTSNRVIHTLENNFAFQEALKQNTVVWNGHTDLFRKLWSELKNHELIINFSKSAHNLNDEKALISGMLEFMVVDSELFEAYIEERYLNWDDDQVLVLSTLQKTLQMLKENSKKVLPEKHKDEEEDLKFVKDLFELTIEKDKELIEMIAAKTQNWDQDRIALVDLILMKMALCEVIYFPFIPVKVSMNEYLELAKLYSTPNSHGFINGILDKVQIDLRKNDKIKKLGRGLVD
ncbi:MAG: transcription antitermination factor NusB [Bacteroidia bacterium]|nr:transcription antitermination factor NusB [Bacteroidia bacterium]MCF8425356.1 transcription antitermination factor NusB [Bacteroidia bacterium]MCF8446861.1 transcription antitermination factor NusB [Bacteroidia bacterium]